MSQNVVILKESVFPENLTTLSGCHEPQSAWTSQPREIGSFSVSPSPSGRHDWMYYEDRRGLGELHRRGRSGQSVVEEIHMPLGKGFQATGERQKPSETSCFEFLLRWIAGHPQEFMKHKSEVTIVCWQDVLKTVLLAPYEKLSGWVISASKIGGLICLSTHRRPVQSDGTDRDEARNARMERDIFWQCKFAQYIINLPKHQESLPDKPINNRFCSILKTRVKDTTIISGGEIVCYDPQKLHMLPPNCYVKLSVQQRPDQEHLWRKLWSRDMRSVWAECYASGIPAVVVGYHDESGNVSMTEEVLTDEIPVWTKSNGRQPENWSERTSVEFMHSFLDLVKATVTEDYTESLYTFEWNPRKSEKLSVEKHSPSSQLGFIPDWYLDQAEKSAYSPTIT